MKRGYFVSLEGPDGAGKTTQIGRMTAMAEKMGIATYQTREPGGTKIGAAIRDLLLNPLYKEMTPLTEMFLYTAARAQLMRESIIPALNEGKLVLSDRFVDSTLAYQAFGGQLDFDFVLETNLKATGGLLPDKTIILDIEPETGLLRCRHKAADRVEQKPLDFHRRVRAGFLELARLYPQRVVVVDGSLSEDEVFEVIRAHIAPSLEILI